jgi:hypothetical protein
MKRKKSNTRPFFKYRPESSGKKRREIHPPIIPKRQYKRPCAVSWRQSDKFQLVSPRKIHKIVLSSRPNKPPNVYISPFAISPIKNKARPDAP